MSITGVSSSNGNYVNYDTSKVAKQNNEKAECQATNKSTVQENSVNKEGKKYKTVSEYSSFLQKKYSYFGKTALVEGIPTTVTVSDAFLKQCMKDPEKAKYLEINLDAIPESVYNSKVSGPGTKTYISFKIEPDGSISTTCGGTNDSDGKIARENAQRKTKKKR